MNEKPEFNSGAPAETQPSDVSRETVDLIEIMGRSMPKSPDPPEDGPGAEAPPQEETAPPPEQEGTLSPPEKNKPSSFYVYLVILFGAAFMMLLLAYFVQKRNNETAITDLRNTMNLSRGELMKEIEALEKENETLQQDNDLLNIRLGQVKEERENYKQQLDQQYYTFDDLNDRVIVKNALDYLELFVDTKDWLMAGAFVQYYDGYFNSLHPVFFGAYTLPSQQERYLELREKVLEQDVMVLEQTPATGGANQGSGDETGEYYEQPTFQDGLFEEQDIHTASWLADVYIWYPTRPKIAAYSLHTLSMNLSDNGGLDRLNNGAFQPSTVALFQQVKADLLTQGYLEETEDGILVTTQPIAVPEG